MELYQNVILSCIGIILLILTAVIGSMKTAVNELKKAISDFNEKTATETLIMQQISERTECIKDISNRSEIMIQCLRDQHADKDSEEMIENWKIGPLMRKRIKEMHDICFEVRNKLAKVLNGG